MSGVGRARRGERLAVLVLSDETYPRHRGGSGKCSHLLAAGLAARGHVVHLLSLTEDGGRREQIDGVEVHRVEPPAHRSSIDATETAIAGHLLDYVRREIRPSELDLVHDSCGFMSYFFPLEHELKRRYGLPLVVHFRYLLLRHQMVSEPRRTFDPFAPRVLGLEACIAESTQCFPVRIADLVLSPSRQDAALIEELYRPAPGTLRVIADPVRLAPPDPIRSGLTRSRIARPGESLVLFGGRIHSDLKGADVVLDAFRRVVRQRRGVRLLVASSDETTAATFTRRLGDAVTFLGWIRDDAEMAAVLRAVDLVVMPSRYESFGLMCAEAMAAGTPVIASPVGGLRDMIADGHDGVLLGGGTASEWGPELAARILELVADPARRLRMGERARIRAARELDLATLSERLEGLYRDLLAAGRHTAGGQAVRAPSLTPGDRELYLSLLGEHGGPAARAAGGALLDRWALDVESRCVACRREGIAEHTRTLVRIGRRPPWGRAGAAADRRRRVEAALAPACPLALVQKGRVRRAAEGGGVRAGIEGGAP